MGIIKKMKPEVKEAWVNALRSGDYRRGKFGLLNVGRYGSKRFSCLGVLTDLYVKAYKTKEWKRDKEPRGDGSYDYSVDGKTFDGLSSSVKKWAGLLWSSPAVDLPDSPSVNFLDFAENRDFRYLATLINKHL